MKIGKRIGISFFDKNGTLIPLPEKPAFLRWDVYRPNIATGENEALKVKSRKIKKKTSK